ncbi:uncharacterized protein LOC142412626 [Mycteria americana]|uniref:uncharacterized protein LOC142412626 n=1 Tax=Mycteria americana TaxID=33587 RepID=UPI003F580E46
MRGAGTAAAPSGPAAAIPPPRHGAESFSLPDPHRSLPLRRAERQLPCPVALRPRAPATNERRAEAGPPAAARAERLWERLQESGHGHRDPRRGSGSGLGPGPAPPARQPRRYPAHREAWLRLLLARGPGTGLLSSPASPAPQGRGRARPGRGRLAGLLADGSGTRSCPDLFSAPCCSCRARKHPGIPEEGGGAAAGPRLAPPPRSWPEERGPPPAAGLLSVGPAPRCLPGGGSRVREGGAGRSFCPALGSRDPAALRPALPGGLVPRGDRHCRARLCPGTPVLRPRAWLATS